MAWRHEMATVQMVALLLWEKLFLADLVWVGMLISPAPGPVWQGCAMGGGPVAELHLWAWGSCVLGIGSNKDSLLRRQRRHLVIKASKLAAVPAGCSEVATPAAPHEGEGRDACHAHGDQDCREGQPRGKDRQSGGCACGTSCP